MKVSDLKKLAEPFPTADIEWRIQRAGEKGDKPWAMVLAYVTNRAIQDRLDAVCGPASWRNEFTAGPSGGVLCGLSILAGDAEWVTKWDGSDNTDVEAVKGGLSSAMKRAAVQWGIGRYLYSLDATWADIHPGGAHYQPKDKQGKYPAFKWDPPELPLWAVPAGETPTPRAAPRPAAPKKTGTKKQVVKEVTEVQDKDVAVKAFESAWDDIMTAIGEDDLDNVTALVHHFIKTTTEKSDAYLVMTDNTDGMSSKEVKLLTAMVRKGHGKVEGLCAGDWRKELSLPALGVETCEVCNGELTEAEKASCAIAKIAPHCTKHVGVGLRKVQEAKDA